MAVRPKLISTKRQPTTRPGAGVNWNNIAGSKGASWWKGWGAKPPAAPSAFTPVGSSASSIGGGAAAPAAPDPRDAQYFNDLAKLEQYYTSRKAEIGAAGESASRDLARSNTLLSEQQPKDTLSAKQNANKAGLFYSGALGKNLGEIETSYARRKTQLNEDYEAGVQARNRQLTDLEGNYGANGLNRNDVLLSAVGRQTERDQAQGVPSAAAPTSLPFTTQAGRSKTGAFGVWHIYPGGRKVFVKSK